MANDAMNRSEQNMTDEQREQFLFGQQRNMQFTNYYFHLTNPRRFYNLMPSVGLIASANTFSNQFNFLESKTLPPFIQHTSIQ